MASHMYTEDFTKLNSRKLNAPIGVVALVLASFLLSYIVSGTQPANPYIGKDAPVNVSEDWHGNVMRSDWGR